MPTLTQPDLTQWRTGRRFRVRDSIETDDSATYTAGEVYEVDDPEYGTYFVGLVEDGVVDHGTYRHNESNLLDLLSHIEWLDTPATPLSEWREGRRFRVIRDVRLSDDSAFAGGDEYTVVSNTDPHDRTRYPYATLRDGDLAQHSWIHTDRSIEQLLPHIQWLDAPEPWKLGSRFYVSRGFHVGTSSWSADPTRIWEVVNEAPLTIQLDGHHPDTGRRYNPFLMGERFPEANITWVTGAPPPVDNFTRISADLQALVRQSPAAACVRGFVRSELGIAPTASETPTTAEAWIEFINNSTPRLAPTARRSMTPTPAPMVAGIPAPRAREETRQVRVSVEEEVSGYTNWTRVDTYSGDMDVPVSVLQEGRRAVREWIMDNYSDHLECEYGDEDNGDSERTDTQDSRLESDNIDDVISELEEEDEDNE